MKTPIKTLGTGFAATFMLATLAACGSHDVPTRSSMAAESSGETMQMASAEPKMVGGAPMYPNKNIIENAVNSKDHETLVAAVKAADLVETLQGEGPFMVFAPTDAAFAQLPEGTVETLLKPENKGQLQQILTYHVVQAEAMSGAINQMIADDNGAHPVPTVSGGTLIAKNDANGNITLTDERGRTATVTIADVDQSNGVIHVVDTVLLPGQ
jgi:uncharacterized surface protein with fasciclin (FAS1) repeats